MTRISWPSTTQVPSFSIASRAAIVSVASVLALADGTGSGGCARSASAVARAVGTSRSRRTLSRVLLRLDPLVRRLAQKVIGRPLGEFDADDDLRLDPVRAAQPRGWVEHRVRTLDLAHPGEELAPRSRAEAAADLAGVGPSVPRANGQDQRAEVGVAALSRQPADDDHLLLAPDLQLQPRLAPAARLVRRAAELRDDPLELLLAGRCEERFAVTLHVARVADEWMRSQAVLQQALALLERHVDERSTVEVEQVEDLVDDRRRLALLAGSRRAPGPDARSVLEEAETRPARLVERHHLAVDDRLASLDPRRVPGERREVVPGVLATAGPEPCRPVPHHGLDPIAIPLHLEQPIRVVERARRQGGIHRLDEVGHRGLAGRGEIDLARRSGGVGGEPRRDAVANLVVREAGFHARRMVLGVPAADRGLVLLLQHEPSLAAVVRIGPDDRVSALEALAVQDELDLALAEADAGRWLAWLGLPGPPVPHDDVSPAVLLCRNDALEVEVLDWVVLGAHRQAADLRVESRPLRDGPADEDAVDLEAEVVVQRRRPMTLNREATAALDDLVRGRLRCPPEVALAPILLQRHRLVRQLELIEGADHGRRAGVPQLGVAYRCPGADGDRPHSCRLGRAHVPGRVADVPRRGWADPEAIRGEEEQVGRRLRALNRAAVDHPRLMVKLK